MRAYDTTLRLYDVSGRMSAALQDLHRGTAYFRTAPEYGEMLQSLGVLQDRVQRVRRLASQPYGSAEIILQEKEAISNSFQRYRNSLENAGDRNRRRDFRLYGDVRFMNDIAEQFRELIRDLDRVTEQLWEQERNMRSQRPNPSQYPQYENYRNVPQALARVTNTANPRTLSRVPITHSGSRHLRIPNHTRKRIPVDSIMRMIAAGSGGTKMTMTTTESLIGQ